MPKLVVEDTFDEWFGDLQADLNSLEDRQVEVGYFEDQIHTESGLPLASIADYNNNGVLSKNGTSYHIPPRPFAEMATMFMQDDIDKYNRLIEDALYWGGKKQIIRSLKMIGQEASDEYRNAIDTQDFKPLAPSTIRQKGSSVILIETNQLYNDATYKIETGGKE